MKKILAVFILLAVSLSLVGCGRVSTQGTAQILYNENGEPVQVFVYDNELNLDGRIYNVYQEDGEYYVNVNMTFKQSGKAKLPILGLIEVNGTFGLSEIDRVFDSTPRYDFLPADSGENFYQGEPILNFYYLDAKAEYPIAVLTDSFEGEVISVILSPITYTDGNEYIILSNDEGEYIYVPFDMDDPDTMLEQMAGYTTPSRKEFYHIKSLEYDENNIPVSAELISGFGPLIIDPITLPEDYEIVVDDSESSDLSDVDINIPAIGLKGHTLSVHTTDNGIMYIAIPDINGGYIYVAFDFDDVGNGIFGLGGAIIIPENVVGIKITRF